MFAAPVKITMKNSEFGHNNMGVGVFGSCFRFSTGILTTPVNIRACLKCHKLSLAGSPVILSYDKKSIPIPCALDID